MPIDMDKDNDLKSLIKSLWDNFTTKRKTQLILITLATFITAVLDIISIGAIMPFISVIMDSEQTFNNPIFKPFFYI